MINKTNWHIIPWKTFYGEVALLQEELIMAYRKGDMKMVYRLQRKLISSAAARAIAVRRVTVNAGSKTPGIDNIVWDSPAQRTKGMDELKEIVMNPKGYKASPVKRVYIPKANSTEKKPLGIPTMIDRA
jgi:RNA-directed DNA polymerase